MVLGALVGLAVEGDDIVHSLSTLTQGISPLVIIVLTLGIAATNA
jgi:NCS1 family nucleobase:cation symporter-1